MNTNELHKKEYIDPMGHLENALHSYGGDRVPRDFPTVRGSLTTKSGLTKKLKQNQVAALMADVEKNGYKGEANLVIEFTNDKQATKIAKSFSRLAENPAFKLSVTFKRIEK